MGTVTPIRQQLVASLVARHGIPAGSTVGDFIEALKALGTEMPLASIEWGIKANGNGRLVIDVDDHGAVELREGTA